MRLRVMLVAGARPNFMKVGPLHSELRKEPDLFDPMLVHTGQHYDQAMSQSFFDDLGIPSADVHLDVGSGSHAKQTAAVMVGIEEICLSDRPDIMLVVGDVNSTLAAAITAKKLQIPLGHVEAGLRSRDWSMPEEVNRVVTDVLSDYLYTPSPDASENLAAEGIRGDRVVLVGNIMIDSLVQALPLAQSRKRWESLGLEKGRYGLLTLHRPSNVDEIASLGTILGNLENVGMPLIFPVHPRTGESLRSLGRDYRQSGTIRFVEPQGYVDFLSLMTQAAFVLTDSGGIQEETTYLNVPCLTLRSQTERPITIEIGTNQLVRPDDVREAVSHVMETGGKRGIVPDLWDGKTAFRIVDHLRGVVFANGT